METAQQIIDSVGRRVIAERIGKSMSAVGKAYQANCIPAMWFDALEQMTGRALPRSAFSFESVTDSPRRLPPPE